MLRSADELASSLADVTDERAYSPDSEFYRGIAAALEWVTGQRVASPMSSAVASNETGVHAELRLAIEMLHGERSVNADLTRAYLSGVEGALAWVLGQTDEAPI